MGTILYSLVFTGAGDAVPEKSGVINVKAEAPGCTITSAVGSEGGVRGRVQATGSEKAKFDSIVTMKEQGAFEERGTIAFGAAGHSLRFASLADGWIGPAGSGKSMRGAVIWKIEGGEGEFAGATGLITSNFLIDEKGVVTDYQTGVIELKG